MKKFLNSVLVVASLLMVSVSAEAAFLAKNDLITVSSGNYYICDNGGSVQNRVTLSDSNIESCLWQITSINNTIITLQNVSTSDYLFIERTGKKTGRLVIGNSATQMRGSFNETGQNDSYIESTLRLAGGTGGNKALGIYCNGSGAWSVSEGDGSTLRLQKWTSSGGGTFDLGITVGNTSFGWYEDDTHTCTISFNPSIQTGTTYTNASNTANSYTVGGTVVTSPATLYGSTYNTRITWTFQSSGNKTSTLRAANYTLNGETERSMLTVSNYDSYNAGTWRPAEITASGASPMNIRSKTTGDMCNYEDRLVIAYSYKIGSTTYNKTYTVDCTRKTFLRETISELTLEVDPADYEFMATLNLTKNLEVVEVRHRDGETLIGVDAFGAESTYKSSFTADEVLDPWASPAIANFSLVASLTSPWLTLTRDDVNHRYVLTALANTTNGHRNASGTMTASYSHAAHNHQMVVNLSYRQSDTDGDVVKFVHSRGASGHALDAKGYQQVHEHETTIYYYPGENIYLQQKQNTFYGYMRWYDYETDRGVEHNSTASDCTTWYRKPRSDKGTYVDLNPDFETFAAGYVATYNKPTGIEDAYDQLSGRSTPNNPIVVGWADGKAHKIAADVSMYVDYVITETQFTEPTLSYRQIFNLLPAQEMVDSLAKCTGTNYQTSPYYEEYKYLAPVGRTIYLTPQFRYRSISRSSTHESEWCYYYDDGGTLKNIGGTYHNGGSGYNCTATWYKDGVAIGTPTYISDDYDYLQVSSNETGIVTYTLRVDALNLNIARFEVDYRALNTVGPTTTTIISQDRINNNFLPLAYNDFSYGAAAPGTNDITYLHEHMPWSDMSFGYFYPDNTPSHEACQTPDFAQYGEYCLLNRIDKSWCVGENHGGAANGYCLYVDGTRTPGVVARISTDASICSGQDIYCSAWICNPHLTGGSNPIFRFNVQGRNSNNEEWQDVAVFMAGVMSASNSWQQVVFPVTAKHDYNQVRVSIYNFAADNDGNDFMIDDLSLYASKLPLAAYQAQTTCSTNERITTIIRMDYQSISDDWSNLHWYYDIYCETDHAEVVVDNFYHADSSDPASNTHGSIEVYANDYDPQTVRPEDIYTSIAAFIDTVHARAERHETVPVEGFVQEEVLGVPHWIAYFVHDLANLSAQKSYVVRMAAAVKDLPEAMCAMRTQLPVVDRMALTLNGENIVSPVSNICANGLFRSVIDISNMLPDRPDMKLTAECMADWLWGYRFDSIYHDPDATPEQITWANSQFVATYGYDRGKVESALSDLRRVGDAGNPNPNRFVTKFEDIERSGFLATSNYDIVASLYNNGFLILGQKEMNFYLGSEQTARFWIYPVPGTAIATYTDEHGVQQEYELQLCTQPQWLDMGTKKTTDQLNIGTRPFSELSDAEKLEIPSVRVAACKSKNAIGIPVSDISSNVVIGRDSTMVIFTNDAAVQAKIDQYGIDDPEHFSMRYFQDRLYSETGDAGYYHVGDTIIYGAVDATHVAAMKAINAAQGLADGTPGFWFPNTDEMKPGRTYRVKTTMLSKSGSAISEADPSCPIGEAYFNLIIVPDTMVWRPTIYGNDWGDDRNWRAIINEVEQDYGWTPLPETHVIIPELANEALYPEITNEVHSYDANYVTNKCRKIYFAPGAKFVNQKDLIYEDAVVDMPIPTNDWYAVAAPLQNVYSGDFFSPVEESSIDPFVAAACGARDNKAGFRYYGAYYNHTVQHLHNDVGWRTRQAAAEWVQSNSVNEALQPGYGMGIAVFGPKGGSATRGIVRLPKQENSYGMYDLQGNASQHEGTVFDNLTRTNKSKFAFQLDKGKDYQTLTLNNEVAGDRFLFGNPTMAYIDMYKFLTDNNLQTYYYKMETSNWASADATLSSGRFLAPMQSVLIVAKQACTQLNLQLKVSHLNTTTTPKAVQGRVRGAAQAPADEERYGLMTIQAYNDDARGETSLAYKDYASNKYDVNEDALFISSGVLNENAVETPLNIYTLASDTALALNVRNTFSQIPVAFLIMDDYSSDTLNLYFTLTRTWNEEMYFCDSKDGSRIRVYNGTQLRIETPNNYEQRYYLQGTAQNDEEQHTPTVIEEIKTQKTDNDSPTELGIAKWIENGILVIRRDGKLYNAQGQIMRVLK